MHYSFEFLPYALLGIAVALLLHMRKWVPALLIIAAVALMAIFPGCDGSAAPQATVGRLTACATNGVCRGEFTLTGTYPPAKTLLVTDVICRCFGPTCLWCLGPVCAEPCATQLAHAP